MIRHPLIFTRWKSFSGHPEGIRGLNVRGDHHVLKVNKMVRPGFLPLKSLHRPQTHAGTKLCVKHSQISHLLWSLGEESAFGHHPRQTLKKPSKCSLAEGKAVLHWQLQHMGLHFDSSCIWGTRTCVLPALLFSYQPCWSLPGLLPLLEGRRPLGKCMEQITISLHHKQSKKSWLPTTAGNSSCKYLHQLHHADLLPSPLSLSLCWEASQKNEEKSKRRGGEGKQKWSSEVRGNEMWRIAFFFLVLLFQGVRACTTRIPSSSAHQSPGDTTPLAQERASNWLPPIIKGSEEGHSL